MYPDNGTCLWKRRLGNYMLQTILDDLIGSDGRLPGPLKTFQRRNQPAYSRILRIKENIENLENLENRVL